MYIYQLCEIAQMVEFNASGLASFYQTLKNVSIAGVKFGKEWLTWFITEFVALLKRTKLYLRSRFEAYFIRQDLSKEELEHQLWVINSLSKIVLAFVAVNVLRITVRLFNKKKKMLR